MRHNRILALIVASGALLCLTASRNGLTQSTGLRRITNTTEEGININPSISGDGRIIAFETTEDVAAVGGSDHFRAIRANIGVDPATLFQMGGMRAVTPAISQDGSRIAFASKDDPLGTNLDGNSEIFLFDGAKLNQITNTSPGNMANRVTHGNFQPSISDDGRFIAFSSNRDLAGQNADGNLEIFVYDTSAASFAQLTKSSGTVGSSDAKISGDGSTVAFIRDTGTSPSAARDLLSQPRVGIGAATVLGANVQLLAMTYGRAISDDGSRVVYAAQTATNTTQVFLFDGRAGGITRQITSLGARVTEVALHPTISGDGSRIAFAARRSVPGAPSNSDGGVELYVFDLPTSTFSKITNAPSSATADVVSSLNDDGSSVVFSFPRILSGAVASSDTANNSEIYVTAPAARPANGTLTAILNDASFGHEPSAIKAVAPESIAAAQGTNLANTTLQSQRLPNGTFPTNVAGTRVSVNERAAEIFFVSPTQVNFLVPPQTEIGTAEVVVTNAEDFPSRGTVPTLRTAPGVFTKTGDGIGEGQILNSDTLQEGPFDPTGGNLRLSIFTTGARNAVQTVVSMGGRFVNADSVMPSPDMPGLDEVHVRVPSDLRGTGTVSLSLIADGRESNPVSVSFLGNPGRAIFINEVLADPPDGIVGDANHDGVRDSTQDEFVELVNGSGGETIGLSGWTIKTRANGSTTETTRFTFTPGTSLPAGEAIVVFGGGTFNPADPTFGCAQVVKTTLSAGLSLTNSGLTILVRDSAGNLIAQFSFGGSTGLAGDNNQSLTRSPDITGSFVQHTAALHANGRRFSTGLKADGTPFGNCPGRLTSVTISPPSTSIVVGQTTQFTAQALDQFGRTMTGMSINFSSDNTSVATIDSTSTNSSTGVVTATVRARNPGTAHIDASATDGSTTANSTPAALTVNGPALSISDVSQNEGNSGTTTFTFTVSLSTPAPTKVTLDIATADNTATVADNDYLARSLTAQTIPAGQQTYSFDVTVAGDLNMEPNETFLVNVTNVIGASLADGQGIGTIISDDIPALSVNDVSATEGNSGTKTFSFTVSSSMPAPSGGVTFDIATADSSATAGSDYVGRSLTGQTIPAGQTNYTFDVTVNGDTLVEPNETLFVNLSNVSANASINDGQGVGTIQNDDTALLVISQLYGGGDNSGAPFRNDFVEVFNRGTATVDFSITPYSVQYASVGSNFSSSNKTNLTTGSIAPGKYFLIQESGGTSNGVALPAPDATGSISMGSTSGKVALVVGTTPLAAAACPGDDGASPFNPSTTAISDLVGYGNSATTAGHCYEGAAPAGAPSNITADFRKAGGCVDTNENGAAFLLASPNPRNSSSPLNDCTAADLRLTKTDSPDPVITGSNVTYTITVTNSGPAVAQSVVVADNLPANVTFVSCTSTGSGVCNSSSGNSRTITFSSLAAGASETITLVATANDPGGTPITNSATVNSSNTDPNPANNTATATTDVNNPNSADLAIGKSDSIDPVAPGGTLTYTISLTNNGPDTAQSVVVTDNLPSGVAFGNCSANQGGVCGGSATSPTISFSSLANGVTATITIHVTANNALTTGAVITNTASVTTSSVDSIFGNNSDSEATTIHEVSPGDVLISEFSFRGSAGANDEFIELYNPTTRTINISGFKIFRSNNAGGTTLQATINSGVLLPPGCHYLFTNSTSYDDGVPGDQTYSTGITDDGGIAVTLASGTASTGILDQVGLSGGSAYKEGVALGSLGTTNIDHGYERKPGGAFGNGTDSNDNTADFFVNASSSNPQNSSTGCLNTSSADLSITKTDSPDPVTIGSNITYTITVLNNGAASAQSVVVTDNLPPEVTFVSCNSTGGVCSGESGNNRTVTAASLASGASIAVTIVATANGPHGGTATNTATVSSATLDANSGNNSATATTLMQEPTPNLSISDVTLNEGSSGPTTFTFNVTLSPASSQTVTVNYATANGTATAPSDYTAIASTPLTFLAGETLKTVNVTVSGDTTVEPDETFNVNLSGATNASITDAQGVGTITNDDGATVVISQIYAGGGNTGAQYTNDFVELLNRTGSTIDVSNWSIQTATATGTSWTVTRLCPVNQTCTIGANKYYLLQLAATNTASCGNAPCGVALPTADASNSSPNLAVSGGKVALVTNTTALTGNAVGTAPLGGATCPNTNTASVVDFVGYGNATCFEGSTAAPVLTNTTANLRASGGCADTNSNSADFATGAPTPRNSTSSHACP